MGRQGSGVEVRPTSIRLSFTWEGEARRETLRINNAVAEPTKANIAYAYRLAREIRDRIRFGTFVYADYFPASGTTGRGLEFGSWLDTWLAAQRIEASTRAGYTSAARFWKQAVVDDVPLGSRALRSLKHSDLVRALATKPGLSGKTVNNYVSVAREALALAVKDGALPTNPADGIERATFQKEPPDPFTREEAEAIIAGFAQHHPGQVHNLVEWWFYTGPRPSEAVGLRWPRVDLASGEVEFREAIVRGVAKANTKTNVVRVVKMNSRARAALERQRAHTQLAGDHVWLDPRYGTAWTDERAFRRSYWTPMLKRLGIRYRSPRHMRHTYATMMLMAGRTPAWCARQLGHSVEMFLRNYSKWLGGEQDDREVAALESWLAQPEKERTNADG